MAKWEYRTLHNNGYLNDSELDEMGQDGWELVSVWTGGQATHYCFKRPVSS